MKRVFLIASLCFFAYSISHYLLYIPPARYAIKTIIETKLSESLSRKIQIGEISGQLFSSIKLSDIVVGNKPNFGALPIAQIDTAELTLSPRLFWGDPNGIKSATFDGIVLNIIRNKEKKINLLTFAKPTTNSSPGNSIFIFKNITGTFYDEIGWRKKQTKFQHNFYGGSAKIQLNETAPITIDATLSLSNSPSKASIKGELDQHTFDYEFNVTQLKTKEWQNYLIPVDTIKLSDDFVTIQGKLTNKETTKKSSPKFYYDIHILFDYLTINLNQHSTPIKNANGKLQLVNHHRPQIQWSDVFGYYAQYPIKSTGAIYFDSKHYNISFKPQKKITELDLMNWMNTTSLTNLSLNASFDAKIQGPFHNPMFQGTIWTNTLAIHGNTLNNISLAIKKQNNEFHIESQTPSNINISGVVRNNNINMDLKLQSYAILNAPSTVNINLNGPLSNPTINASLVTTNHTFFGYTISTANSLLKLTNNQLDITHAEINLDNGQTLTFEGTIDLLNNSATLHQTAITSPKNRSSNQQINTMTSHVSCSYLNNQWVVSANGTITGKGAVISTTQLDNYQFNYAIHDGLIDVAIDSAHAKGQSLEGRAIFNKRKLHYLNAKLTNVELSTLNTFNLKWLNRDLSGTGSGRILYQNKNKLIFNTKLDIKNFKTSDGEFGNLYVDILYKNDIFNILNLKLRGLHYANIKGSFKHQNDLTLSFLSDSMFRLDAFNYFSKRKLSGYAKINGTISKSNDNFLLNGRLKSSDLEFDGHRFDYIFAELKKDNKSTHIKHLILESNGGKMTLNGQLFPKKNDPQLIPNNTNLTITFKNFNLQFFSNLWHSYASIQNTTTLTETVPITWNLNQSFAFHKYQSNNLDTFEALLRQQEKKQSSKWPIGGKINGKFQLNTSNITKNKFNLTLNDITWSDHLKINNVHIKTSTFSPNKTVALLTAKDTVYHGKKMEALSTSIAYFPKETKWTISNQNILYQKKKLKDILTGSLIWDERYLDLNINLKKNDINILTLPLKSIESLENDGHIAFSLTGKLNDLQLNSSKFNLTQFNVLFNKKYSPFNSPFSIENASPVITNGAIQLKPVKITWKGTDTYRRINLDKKRNAFIISGNLSLSNIDIMDQKSIQISYDLTSAPTFISVNLSNLYSGDIQTSKLKYYGSQTYALTPKGHKKIQDTLETNDESGATLSGKIKLTDGIFNIPKMKPDKTNARIQLNMDVTLGKGNFIQGSLIKNNMTSLANNISLEIDQQMEQKPFKVLGTLNAPKMSTSIYFYDGSLTFFDGVYELISQQQQQHFFKEFPDLISEQYITIESEIKNGTYNQLIDLQISAIRTKDIPTATENIRNKQFPYPAVILIFNQKGTSMLSGLSVLDYGLTSKSSIQPDFEYYGTHQLDLSGNQSILNSTNVGLNLIMPDIISNSENLDIYNIGRHRINNIFKSSIRPYERRLAQRFGLYDLRLDYDVGQKVFSSVKNEGQSQDLLGLSIVSNLYNEAAFLNIRADVDLSSDEVISSDDGVKITQVELTYYFQPNFNIRFKNINEYSEKVVFDPRFSINYGHAF